MKNQKSPNILLSALFVVISLIFVSCGSLTRSASGGDVAGIKKYLDQGEPINKQDKTGKTPLMWAVYYSQSGAAKYLLERGADPNARTSVDSSDWPAGSTALMICAYYNVPELAKLLLEAGADRNIKNSKGETALLIAGRYNNGDIIALLDDIKEKGAIPERSKAEVRSEIKKAGESGVPVWTIKMSDGSILMGEPISQDRNNINIKTIKGIVAADKSKIVYIKKK